MSGQKFTAFRHYKTSHVESIDCGAKTILRLRAGEDDNERNADKVAAALNAAVAALKRHKTPREALNAGLDLRACLAALGAFEVET